MKVPDITKEQKNDLPLLMYGEGRGRTYNRSYECGQGPFDSSELGHLGGVEKVQIDVQTEEFNVAHLLIESIDGMRPIVSFRITLG